MGISAKCDYACRAILELALHWPNGKPLSIHQISKNQDIPMKYLVHILIQLKKIGLVESVRGKQGGYKLAKAPHKISLGEVTGEIGGSLLPIANSARRNQSVFTEIWKETGKAMSQVLDKITFEDIVNKVKVIKEAIVYQI